MTRIAVVAPAGVSTSHGIVDQARQVVSILLERGHEVSLYVVISPRSQEPDRPEDPRLAACEQHVSLDGVWRVLPESVELLWVHWANYGLARLRPLGVPLGFVRGLRSWRRSRPTVSTVLSVHEGWDAPAEGERWKRLRADLQRRALLSAAQGCDQVSVNCERWLDAGWPGGAAPVTLIPVFSNFPAPTMTTPPEERHDVVVMGGDSTRRALLEHLGSTDVWGDVAAAEITQVHDIGTGSAGDLDLVRGRPVVRHGFLPAQEVADVLAGCTLGVVRIPSDVAGKSSILSAYRELGLHAWNLMTDEVLPPDATAPGPSRTADWLLGSPAGTRR